MPIKIIVLNNQSLGMIRHFQEMYFNSCYTQTIKNMGYESPDFSKVAEAYGIKSITVNNIDKQLLEIKQELENENPVLIQLEMSNKTYLYPKLAVNKPIYDQEPKLDEKLIEKLLNE